MLDDKEKKKEMDIIHIQKTLRYFEYLTQREDIDFSNFHYGSVSTELDESMEALSGSDLVDEIEYVGEKGSVFVLTGDGEKCAEEVEKEMNTVELRKLSFAKQQLNDLPLDELFFFMYRLLPQSAENSTVAVKLEKRKDELTRKLYKKGRINLNTATRWSGLDEKEFLAYISKDT
jgi:hypothetical protein